MHKKIRSYYSGLRGLTQEISVTGRSDKAFDLESGIEESICLITACKRHGGKLMFAGNGASASISSHMAVDFWKNAEIGAISFNDAALLTCISNDFGYSQVFEKPIEMFANSGDIFLAISSSGKSENIIRGVRMAQSKGCKVITFSGFNEENPLRSLGNINFHVPSSLYGHVEVVHHSICHCMLDTIVSTVNKGRLND